jgi:hypothetical protein
MDEEGEVNWISHLELENNIKVSKISNISQF